MGIFGGKKKEEKPNIEAIWGDKISERDAMAKEIHDKIIKVTKKKVTIIHKWKDNNHNEKSFLLYIREEEKRSSRCIFRIVLNIHDKSMYFDDQVLGKHEQFRFIHPVEFSQEVENIGDRIIFSLKKVLFIH